MQRRSLFETTPALGLDALPGNASNKAKTPFEVAATTIDRFGWLIAIRRRTP